MNNPGLIKSFVAEAAIAPFRIVNFGSDDDSVVQSAAATDAMFGVSDSLGAEPGSRVDVVMSDVTDLDFGGTVTRGDQLTSDADGKGVTAAPAAGTNVRVIGIAMVSGVAGDIGSVRIAPTQIQG